MNAVSRPTARLHLIRVQTPELQLLLKQRSTYIGRIVQLSRSASNVTQKNELAKSVRPSNHIVVQPTAQHDDVT